MMAIGRRRRKDPSYLQGVARDVGIGAQFISGGIQGYNTVKDSQARRNLASEQAQTEKNKRELIQLQKRKLEQELGDQPMRIRKLSILAEGMINSKSGNVP